MSNRNNNNLDNDIQVDTSYVPTQLQKEIPNSRTVTETNNFIVDLFNKYATKETRAAYDAEQKAALSRAASETCEEVRPRPIPKTTAEILEKAKEKLYNNRLPNAIALDTTLKSSLAFFEYGAAKVNIELPKSINRFYANQWNEQVKAYDKFITTHQGPWPAIVKAVKIASFVFQMGLARKIPDFVLGLLGALSPPSPTTVVQLSMPENTVPSPSKTVDIFMEHPLACLAIGTGLVATFTALSLCTYTLKVLRIIRK